LIGEEITMPQKANHNTFRIVAKRKRSSQRPANRNAPQRRKRKISLRKK